MRSVDPVIPQIAHGLNVEPATAALLSTAFTLPYALVQPVLGALADMFSKARLMLLCMLIVAIATLACGFATNFETCCAARARRASPPAAYCRSPLRWSATEFRCGAPGGHRQAAVCDHDRQSAGRDRRRRDRRPGRLARRVLRDRRHRSDRAGGRHSRLSRRWRDARPLRSLDAWGRTTARSSAIRWRKLLRRGVPGSGIHVRRVSLHGRACCTPKA